MDEYCNHCAQKHGATNNFVGLARYGQTAHVYCKGCGITHVNHLGECLKCKSHVSTVIQNKSYLVLFLFTFMLVITAALYLFK